MSDKITGQVTEYDAAKGFGRVEDEEGRSYFLHFREVPDGYTPQPGDAIRFLPVLHRKGNLAQQAEQL